MLLLTGATGQAGSHVAREFVRHATPVRLLVRDRTKAAEYEGVPSIEIVEGDMSRPDTLAAALAGVERALMISSSLPDMVETQCGFADACAAAGVRHLIKFSGLDAREETTFMFGRMHKQIERHIERSGLKWTHLRPTGFMQEYLREVPTIVEQGAIFLSLADAHVNPVDLADVGQAAHLLLRDGGHEGECLPMTGPESLTVAEIAERITEATGRQVSYVPVPAEARHQALVQHGVPESIADALDRQVEERIKGGLEERVDLSTHKLFGIRPRTFLEFARANVAAFSGENQLAGA